MTRMWACSSQQFQRLLPIAMELLWSYHSGHRDFALRRPGLRGLLQLQKSSESSGRSTDICTRDDRDSRCTCQCPNPTQLNALKPAAINGTEAQTGGAGRLHHYGESN